MRKAHSSDAFLLGANFGISFRAEMSAEGVGATQEELRMVAMQAASARVTFEAQKANLRLTDADVVSILGINRLRFAAWKARLETRDQDHSVRKANRISICERLTSVEHLVSPGQPLGFLAVPFADLDSISRNSDVHRIDWYRVIVLS